jgi:hypothetical protein
VIDYDNIKEIKGIPDSIQLQGIYRVTVDTLDGITIWIVDGYLIRKDFYPEFGFGGNDLSYYLIPPKEIWIDGQVSCEETGYSIATEMMERKGIEAGKSYDDAYSDAIDMTLLKRQSIEKLAASHFKLAVPDSLTKNMLEQLIHLKNDFDRDKLIKVSTEFQLFNRLNYL